MTQSSRAVPETGVVEELRAENQRLRAALARSDQPCAYCTLPAAEWAKCASGFPGCDRADDAMGCPELGATMRTTTAERERDEAMAALREKEERVKALEEALGPFAAAADACDVEDDLRIGLVRTEQDIWESPPAASITFGDLYRARSLTSVQPVSGSREQRGNEEG